MATTQIAIDTEIRQGPESMASPYIMLILIYDRIEAITTNSPTMATALGTAFDADLFAVLYTSPEKVVAHLYTTDGRVVDVTVKPSSANGPFVVVVELGNDVLTASTGVQSVEAAMTIGLNAVVTLTQNPPVRLSMRHFVEVQV